MKDKHTSILQSFSPLIASLTIGMFLFSSCSNISTVTDTDTGKSAAQGTQATTGSEKYMDKSGIEFTGNPAYDIGLLNEWWAKNGTPFPAPTEESTIDEASSAARSAGFGDLVLNFTGKGFLEWAGGTFASGAAGALVGAGVSAVLNALGIVRSVTSYLNEISDRLDRMQGQLDSIQTMLNETAKEVEDIIKDVQKAGDLARYRDVLNNRDKRYIEVYTSVMDAWNKINDVLLIAALSSQYGKDTVAYKAKLDELKTRKLRLEYIGQFIDHDSLLVADDAAEVSFKKNQATQSFIDYFARHSEEISAELHEAVRNWGEGELGAARLLSLCSYLTNPAPNFNMFQLYDKYAEASFVWESEGYTFRQQLRDQDSALIALAAPLSYWYYAITESLGTNSSNCIMVTQYVNDAIKLNTDYPVIKKDKPYYQKWGSDWKGQSFTGVIKKIDYGTVIKNEWQTSQMEWVEYLKKQSSDTICWVYNRSLGNEYTGSRIYAGLGRKELSTSDAFTRPCSEAENLAMDEEWYKEMIDAYAVVNSNSDMTLPIKPIPNVTLLKIFENAGFTLENGLPLSKVNIKNKENYFITKYGITADVTWTEGAEFIVSIPAVHADTTKDIIVDRETRKHYAEAVRYEGHFSRILILIAAYESAFKICKEVLKTYDRGFYTPVKQ